MSCRATPCRTVRGQLRSKRRRAARAVERRDAAQGRAEPGRAAPGRATQRRACSANHAAPIRGVGVDHHRAGCSATGSEACQPFSAGPRGAGTFVAPSRATLAGSARATPGSAVRDRTTPRREVRQLRAGWLQAMPSRAIQRRAEPGRAAAVAQRRASRAEPFSTESSRVGPRNAEPGMWDSCEPRHTPLGRAGSGRAAPSWIAPSLRCGVEQRRAGSGNADPRGAEQRRTMQCNAEPGRVVQAGPRSACRAMRCRTVRGSSDPGRVCSSRLCRATQGQRGAAQVVQRLGSGSWSGAVSSQARIGNRL
ncbi:hypothetical protein APR12_006441 [Nocardia amikacinitolerans]|nr:hypothetical protein [Nocardia amikacinitolerans]